jgi:hypothetical protein
MARRDDLSAREHGDLRVVPNEPVSASAHPSHAMQGRSCVACGVVASEMAANLPCVSPAPRVRETDDPIARLHNFVDGLQACDKCNADPNDETGPNVLCSPCLAALTPTWQPIETAPKVSPNDGGTAILAWWPSRYAWPVDAYWDSFNEGWKNRGDELEEDGQPTHWMTLPEPPIAKDGRASGAPTPDVDRSAGKPDPS